MIDLSEFIIEDNGKILEYNNPAEQILNELSTMKVSEPGLFILDKIKNNKFVLKTFSKTYGIKSEKKDSKYFISMISLDEFNMNIDSFIDINSLQHEIKNPLTIINGTAQLLSVKSSDEYTKKCSEIIIKETDRIKLLLENIGLMSDISLEKTSFYLKEFFMEIIDSLKILFPDIIFKFELDPSIEQISGDRAKLFMAFNNIIKNACEAQKSGTIIISYKLDPFVKYFDKDKNRLSSMIKFSIIDRAKGIEKEMLNKIFTPFFTTKSKGTGLGLVIAKELIEKHQGRIDLISEKNIGTTFNILLPL
jgi:nitrogen-specific signal transduction histidine kinase